MGRQQSRFQEWLGCWGHINIFIKYVYLFIYLFWLGGVRGFGHSQTVQRSTSTDDAARAFDSTRGD